MPKLSETQREDLLAIAGQRDGEIDYSDIPPIQEIPSNAVRGRFYRGQAIYLTDELHAYLSTVAVRRGMSLNDLVNNVLSKEVALVEELK
jgi:predicted HicB family RNase H-like nuclease